MGFMAVGLKCLRNKIERLLVAPRDDLDGVARRHLLSGIRKERLSLPYANACRAVAVFITLTWDYLLMLAVMTCNVGIFFSVVTGVAAGYLCFGHTFGAYYGRHAKKPASQPSYPHRTDVACSPIGDDDGGQPCCCCAAA